MTDAGHPVERRPALRSVALDLGTLATAGQAAVLAAALALGAVLRVWQLDAVGYNSDEAVYAGQGAALARDADLSPYFPIFRAHPLLVQTLLSAVYRAGGVDDVAARLVAVSFGLATVAAVFLLGHALFGRRVGLLAALLVAVMPYHVVVSRQVLLDGPMVFFATVTLLLVVRHARTGRPIWLYAAGCALGLTVLAKETSIVLLGALYAFYALVPSIRVRVRELAIALACMAVTIAPYPLSLAFAGRHSTGQSYLAWQLFRRPNHDWSFYWETVPLAIGLPLVVAAVVGLVAMWRRAPWQRTLLTCWIAVPVAFFQLWPVKGFQYLLPVAPAVALLGAYAIARVAEATAGAAWSPGRGRVLIMAVLATLVAASLAIESQARIGAPTSGRFLAGSGGVPGAREAGRWIRGNTPQGARLLTIGPSMANLVQYYGHRKAYGLSVSPNPLRRNPSYEPVPNPDLLIRHTELHYLVWDSFSAQRSPFFADQLLRYADRYNGRVVHTQSVEVETAAGERARLPLIVVYAVRPITDPSVQDLAEGADVV